MNTPIINSEAQLKQDYRCISTAPKLEWFFEQCAIKSKADNGRINYDIDEDKLASMIREEADVWYWAVNITGNFFLVRNSCLMAYQQRQRVTAVYRLPPVLINFTSGGGKSGCLNCWRRSRLLNN